MAGGTKIASSAGKNNTEYTSAPNNAQAMVTAMGRNIFPSMPCSDKSGKYTSMMIATENADKVGEFSLTDRRFSRITKFMAQTLFDENVGGPFGNTHIAVGASYHDCYDGNPDGVSKAEWARLGFNDSSVHTDIVSTTDRTVTATMRDGSELVIYAGGEFQI